MPPKKKKVASKPSSIRLPDRPVLEEWDSEVLRCTDHFQADKTTIALRISGGDDAKSYEVSRALLIRKAPGLAHMISESMSGSVVIYHDARDFEDFLWFIHVDPLNLLKYINKCPVTEKFRRALRIGLIANYYSASTIRRWAIEELQEHIVTCARLENLPLLHRFAASCRYVAPTFYRAVHDAWRSTIRSTPDPVAALIAAKEAGDQSIQAFAYAYILRTRSGGTIAADPRLTTLDRVRLNVGSLNLQPYPCGCKTASLSPANSFCRCVKETYGDHSLWGLFTHSEMGFTLADNSLDLSALALRQSPVLGQEDSSVASSPIEPFR